MLRGVAFSGAIFLRSTAHVCLLADSRLVSSGERIYRKGRKAFARAEADRRPEKLHESLKRALEFLVSQTSAGIRRSATCVKATIFSECGFQYLRDKAALPLRPAVQFPKSEESSGMTLASLPSEGPRAE
jgi:hypothetical protein